MRSTSTTKSLALGNTTSQQHTDSSTKTHGETTTLSQSETNTINQTLSHSKQRTVSHTDQKSNSKSSTRTKQNSTGKARTQTAVHGGGESTQWGENWTKAIGKNRSVQSNENTGWSENEGDSDSRSESWRPEHGVLGDQGKYIPILRENETVNYQTGKSSGKGRSGGSSQGKAEGTSETSSSGGNTGGGANTTWSDSEADSTTVGTSISDGATVGSGSSTSDGTSDGTTEGKSITEGRAIQKGTAHATSDSVATGVSDATGTGTSAVVTEGETASTNETVHKRPLLTPEEITLHLGPQDGRPELALVLIDGKRPAIVHRSPYYRDVGFQWLFDPDPNYPHSCSKLIGPIHESVVDVNDPDLARYTPTVSWLVEEGGRVERGQALFSIKIPGPKKFLQAEFRARHHEEISGVLTALTGEVVSKTERGPLALRKEPLRVGVPVFSPITGSLSKQEVRKEKTDGGVETVVEVVGNRRHHLEAQKSKLPIPMSDYFKYLKDLHLQQQVENDARRKEEQERAEKEAREKERVEIEGREQEDRRLEQERVEKEAREKEEHKQWRQDYDAQCKKEYEEKSALFFEEARELWWKEEKIETTLKACVFLGLVSGFIGGLVLFTLVMNGHIERPVSLRFGLVMLTMIFGGIGAFIGLNDYINEIFLVFSEKERHKYWSKDKDLQKTYIDRLITAESDAIIERGRKVKEARRRQKD